MLWALLKPSSLTVRRRDGEDRAAERNAQAAKKSPPEGLGRPQASAAGGFIGEEQQCKQVPSFTCTCTRARTHAYTCTCVCIHAHMRIPVHAYVCTHARTRMDMCSHKYAHASTCSSEGQKGLALGYFYCFFPNLACMVYGHIQCVIYIYGSGQT